MAVTAADVLIDTILSQNTSAANSDAGYRRLRRKFRSWNQVANAPLEEVEKCIRISGLSNLKRLYLWQTKVTAAGADNLKKSLPNI